MVHLAALVCSALLTAPPALPADLEAFHEAEAKVGRDADAHVKLALWCEAHGLQAERLKHLAIAILTDPANITARGLMGLVAYHGKWQRPDAVAENLKFDDELAAALAEYNARRAKTAGTADAQWKLALWCEEKGLKAEALAHLSAVVRLDPSREAAWKRLGCKKVGGRWVTEAQISAAKAEAEAQKQANKHWHPLLVKWRGWLDEKSKRVQAEELLSGVTDPRAVPSVWATFALGSSAQQTVAVRILGQIDSPGSSRGLATLALSDASIEVRRAATETLRRRDPREFAGLLVAMLRDPIKYEVRPVGGPGSPGALFVQGKRVNIQRIYAPPAMPYIPYFPGETVYTDQAGLPVVMRSVGMYSQLTHSQKVAHLKLSQLQDYVPIDPTVAQAVQNFRNDPSQIMGQFFLSHPITNRLFHTDAKKFNQVFSLNITENTSTAYINQAAVPIGQIALEYQKAAYAAQEQLAGDIVMVEGYNTDVTQTNDRALQVLRDVAGQDLGDQRENWISWWTNLKGYAYISEPDQYSRPTLVQNVPLAYVPQPVPVQISRTQVSGSVQTASVDPVSTVSCFGAGTSVRTLEGPRLIETLRVGDQVLTQSTRTGGLAYHSILVVHHNPPSPTFLIKLAGDTIVSSPFHRFWKAGKGWVMARDLKVGDTLRLLDGPASVDSVETGPVQPVFNLDVADDHDFFAGTVAALVHDNTLPELREVPFDTPSAPGAVAARTRN